MRDRLRGLSYLEALDVDNWLTADWVMWNASEAKVDKEQLVEVGQEWVNHDALGR